VVLLLGLRLTSRSDSVVPFSLSGELDFELCYKFLWLILTGTLLVELRYSFRATFRWGGGTKFFFLGGGGGFVWGFWGFFWVLGNVLPGLENVSELKKSS